MSGEPRAGKDINEIQKKLAALLNAKIHKENSREYVPSDALAVYYMPNGQPIEGAITNTDYATPVFVAHIRLSWVATYAMIDWKMTKDRKVWHAYSEDNLPSELARISTTIKQFLEEEGYQILSGTVLDEIVPGQYSGLDDSPASVRAILFSEID